MFRINENYLRLPGSYLFSTIAKKAAAYQQADPDKTIIHLRIDDTTLPIVPAVMEAIHKAADEMGHAEASHDYTPGLGCDFLREAIVQKDYMAWGCRVFPDEIFISDRTEGDRDSIQEIFSPGSGIAMCDPVYPVYADSNVMAGRTGEYDETKEIWNNVIYVPYRSENHFVPEPSKETPNLIYLCNPSNPTGTMLAREQLKVWMDYANRIGAIVLYDAAYEVHIAEPEVPHSTFEIQGARTCAIEFRSFSKKAGFTGVRLGFTVVPKGLVYGGAMLHPLWARRHGTKFNGAPCIEQKVGLVVYSEEGSRQIMEQVVYYMRDARVIYNSLKGTGYTVYGSVDSPYIWLKTEQGVTSWEFFGHLLEQTNAVGTPGSGLGPSGEGYFQLATLGTYENTVEAVERIKASRK